MLTGLEIGSIVIGCVNATLAAAKLLQDWYAKRRERQKAEANQKLAISLKSDATSASSAYTARRSQLPKQHRHRFEQGDELSRAELEPHKRKIDRLVEALQKSIRSSKSKNILPNLQKYLATSKDAHHGIIRALARLHQRIIHQIQIPKSLNPLKALFQGRKKDGHASNKLVRKPSPSVISIASPDKVTAVTRVNPCNHACNVPLCGNPSSCALYASRSAHRSVKNNVGMTKRPHFFVEYEVRQRPATQLVPVRVIAPVYPKAPAPIRAAAWW